MALSIKSARPSTGITRLIAYCDFSVAALPAIDLNIATSLSHWSNRIIFTSVFLSDFELVKHEKVDECFNHVEQAETCRVKVWRRISFNAEEAK